MGIISWIATEIAKDVALDLSIGAMAGISNGIEKVSEHKESRRREKILSKNKKGLLSQHLIVSLEQDEKSFWGNKIKARKYLIELTNGTKLVAKRVVKTEGTSLIEMRSDDAKKLYGTINELKKQTNPCESIFLITIEGKEYGRIFTQNSNIWRYVSKEQKSWDVIQNDDEYLISHEGVVVGKSLLKGHKLKKHSLVFDYVDQNDEAILFVAISLMCLLDKMH